MTREELTMKRLRLLVVLLATLTSAGVSPAADRPNVLWLSCEDISAHLGCYGDPNATTPHLGVLAEEGIRYTHAFVTGGGGAPCLTAISTGMY